MKRSLALLTLLLAGAAIPAFPAGKVADDFAAPDSGDLWEVNLGYNLKNTIVPGAEGPRKIKCTVFKIEHKDSSKSSDGNGRWFTAIRLLNVNREDWKKAVGFSIMLATDNPNAWYFSMGLSEEDGTIFSLPAKPSKLFKVIFKTSVVYFSLGASPIRFQKVLCVFTESSMTFPIITNLPRCPMAVSHAINSSFFSYFPRGHQFRLRRQFIY